MTPNLIKIEKILFESGNQYIAGIDEVGRGALAGPMVVSAVILNPKHLIEHKKFFSEYTTYTQIKDSKKLTANKRLHINEFLLCEVISYSLVEVPHTDIDAKGLTTCTQEAFFKAIKKLEVKPDHIITDSYEIKMIAQNSQTNIPQGDNKSISVAAASIIAKVYRDNLMTKLHNKSDKYKIYRFDKHKGYGTKLHRDAIKEHGYSDIHRLSYNIK